MPEKNAKENSGHYCSEVLCC